ncbi:MAG: hypothetical protein Q8P15_01020 [Nanoarchaeota archaeon]|nr:hypothetical protein [Nanoarchaeota archaeon]
MKKNRKAAMEMSVGTIVTIVLLMTVLILGIFLVQRIFGTATTVIDLTDNQLREEINKLFGEDKELVIYPSSRRVEIKQEDEDGVGIGIKNLLQGTSGTSTFSYEVVVSDASDCSESKEEIEEWFTVGQAEENIPIPVGSSAIQKVLFRIPTGTSLCTARFRVNVNAGEKIYATDFFDITVKAK